MNAADVVARRAMYMSPEYHARSQAVLPQGFVAVQSAHPSASQVHVVKGRSFGDVALRFRKFGILFTLCDREVTRDWSLVSRHRDGTRCQKCQRRAMEAADNV